MIGLVREWLGKDPAAGLALHGVLAEYESAHALYHACEQVRDAGYRRWDAHSPFPIHGLERAMGLAASRLPWIVLVCGMAGAVGGFGLQAWVHLVGYPLVISGKPLFAWPAYIPITFELGVLLGAFGAFFGMLALIELPRLHHSLFNSRRFERVTDDRFFISIEAIDPQFDVVKTADLLRTTGAVAVEEVER